jgi:hypothetical protein
MPSYESSMQNLEKAQASWRPPRPCRSSKEGEIIRRFVFLWFTCRDPNRPSGRSWAKQLGISHTWLQKLVRQFRTDPSEMWRLQARRGDPQFADLTRARELTQQMKENGLLRSSPRARLARFLAH